MWKGVVQYNLELCRFEIVLLNRTYGKCVFGFDEVEETHIIGDDYSDIRILSFPECSVKCKVIKVLGAGECESVCPEKFKK